MSGRACGFAIGLAALSAPAIARADDPKVSEARAAYKAGADAYDSHDYASAAVAFARADSLAPNETVLRLALTSCGRAEDVALCMNLVERARARNVLADSREEIAARFAPRAARVRLECPGTAACSAHIDGAPLAAGDVTWVTAGPHLVAIESPNGNEHRSVTFAAGQDARIAPSPKALADVREPISGSPLSASTSANAGAAEAPPGGLSPAWFWVGAGVTAVLGGVTVWSGADTLHRHGDFALHPTAAGADDGLSAERRTNVLLGGTIAAAAITTVVGIVFVRWSRH